MPIIKITSQAELDALQDQFEQWTEIQIVSAKPTIVRRTPKNSSVVAWENSSVVARGNSSVVAWGQVAARYCSEDARLTAHGLAVIFQHVNPAKKSHLKGEHVFKVEAPSTTEAWLGAHGVTPDANGNVILFKRVSADFKTQEGTRNETLWAVGSTLMHPEWNPTESECGEGKFHACAKTYFCNEFRFAKGDRYVALKINVADLYVWPKNPAYPHKIAFRMGTVLYEVDRFGNRLEAAAVKLVPFAT
jgi:hypothetical protein